MTKIGPIPPSQPSPEPDPLRGSHKHSHPRAHDVTPSSRGSHQQKLRRFARAQGPSQARETLAKTTPAIPSPIRHEWNENQGYCGEACMVAALMMFGGYCSQFTARQLAGLDPSNSDNFDGFDPTKLQTTCQLLLGDNAQFTAEQLQMTTEKPTQAQAANGTSFLQWVRSEVSQGHPVMIGVYENQSVFHQSDEQPDYDHIVTVTQMTDTTITFNDNGLYGPPQQDTFTVPISQFLQDRSGADSPNAPIYSLCSDGPCYGLAITGVNDGPGHEALPVSLASSSSDEDPEIGEGSNTAPAGSPITLTPTVSGLVKGKQYVLYCYNDPSKVPSSDFNAESQGATKYVFTATGTTMTLPPQAIQSSDTAIFRCVPIDGS